jgi:hypothetical protein
MRSTATIAAALLATVAMTSPAAAAEQPPLDCAGSARVLVTPGLTLTPQDFTFLLTGTFGPCQTVDGSAQTATISARGTGTGSCLGTRTTVPFTVTWTDGRTSTGQSEAVTSGPLATMTGRLVSGRFAGAAVQSSLVLVPGDPFQCGLNGVTSAVAYGQIAFIPA